MGNADKSRAVLRRTQHVLVPSSKLQQAAQEAEAIRRLLHKTAMNIVQVGLRLRLVHDALGRDHFQHWLREEFDWSQSVASNYMRAAERFAEIDCLTHFQPSALYVLARRNVPEPARQEALDRARSGELITKSQAERLVAKHGVSVPVESRRVTAIRNSLRRALRHLHEIDRENLDPAAFAEISATVNQLQTALQGKPAGHPRKRR